MWTVFSVCPGGRGHCFSFPGDSLAKENAFHLTLLLFSSGTNDSSAGAVLSVRGGGWAPKGPRGSWDSDWVLRGPPPPPGALWLTFWQEKSEPSVFGEHVVLDFIFCFLRIKLKK